MLQVHGHVSTAPPDHRYDQVNQHPLGIRGCSCDTRLQQSKDGTTVTKPQTAESGTRGCKVRAKFVPKHFR